MNKKEVDIMLSERKNIFIISGSPRKKGDGYKITEFLIEKFGDNNYDWQYIFLADYKINGCIGCRLCNRKHEETCPLKDDLLDLVDKMKTADGFVFTSPVYSLAVTSQMKAFIDRTNYLLHRPAFIGKPTVIISTTDLAGEQKVIKYLKHIITTMGLRYSGGLGIKMGLYKNNDSYKQKTDIKIESLSKQFRKSLEAGDHQKPSFKQALLFRLWQTRALVSKDKNPYDYEYWSERGWMDSDYFYPTNISKPKKILINIIRNKMIKKLREGFSK